MSKDEFLTWAAVHTPWTTLPIAEIPDEWRDELESVWQYHHDFHENICRSINKGGSIWVPVEALREYAKLLPVEEQVAFYWSLREYHPWREPEFRPDFERGFPDCVDLLPTPLTAEELEWAWQQVIQRSVVVQPF